MFSLRQYYWWNWGWGAGLTKGFGSVQQQVHNYTFLQHKLSDNIRLQEVLFMKDPLKLHPRKINRGETSVHNELHHGSTNRWGLLKPCNKPLHCCNKNKWWQLCQLLLRTSAVNINLKGSLHVKGWNLQNRWLQFSIESFLTTLATSQYF